MDPAITAALITTPTAVLAAATAYAAGRAQANAAHRGPVDAVRRQHQRDAYAHLLATVHTYSRIGTGMSVSLRITPGEAPGAEEPINPDAVVSAVMAVRLEGPEHLADLADAFIPLAYDMHAVLGAMSMYLTEPIFDGETPEQTYRALSAEFDQTAEEFADAASAHLNTGKPPNSRRLLTLPRRQ
ncbi:hypothetical protein ACGFWF_23685 [Streptomyces sp. NPDC048581]|uniref:hypothetical protein n=1 Tax=Streptomyces sp. NPDC048581 TaxID=3365572 RepID=UPI00371686C1